MALAYLEYNDHEHPAGSVMFTIQRRTLYGRTSRRKLIDHNWNIRGFVQGNTVNEISTQIAAVEDAYVPGGDLTFYADGTNPSEHVLSDADLISGMQVRSFNWLGATQRGSNVEYVFRRSFSAIVGGYEDPGYQDTDIELWTESVSRIGDGTALNVWMESLAGLAEAQQVMATPKHVTIQQGMAIGLTDYPTPAAPIWGAPYYISTRTNITRTTPTFIGMNGQRFYMTRWRYEFHSDVGLVGDPTEF